MVQSFAPGAVSRRFRGRRRQLSLVLLIGLSSVWIQTASSAQSAGQTTPNGAGPQAPAIRPLEPGRPVEAELAGGQSHTYQLTLTAGQFVKLLIEQHGIEVVMRLRAPDGKGVLNFVPLAKESSVFEPEFVTRASGVYQIVMRSQQSTAAGRFRIEIREVRAATENELGLQEARDAYDASKQMLNAARFDEARTLAESAVQIREKLLGPKDPAVAEALDQLANIHADQGQYQKAEPLYRQAMEILEQSVGPNELAIVRLSNDMGMFYHDRGNYEQAESFYKRAITMAEANFGPNFPDLAPYLNNLAGLYREHENYAQAEPLYQRAIVLMERMTGPENVEVAKYLNNLGNLHNDKGDYAKAIQFYQRSLEIKEKILDPEHPSIASSLLNLGNVYLLQDDYAKAEPILRRALTIDEKVLKPDHPLTANTVTSLATIYLRKGDSARAEPLFQRALLLREKALGPEHESVGTAVNSLALVYLQRREYGQVEPLLKRALSIWEKAYGPEHSKVTEALHNLAGLYVEQHDYARAEPLYLRALTILEKASGPEHPATAGSLHRLANLYYRMKDYAKAEPLYLRALAILERTLGSNNTVADTLQGLARLSWARGSMAQAVAFQSRANEARERLLALNLATGSERQKLTYLDLFAEEANLTLSLQSQGAPNDPQALNLAFTTVLRRKGRGLEAMTDTVAAFRRHATPQNQELFDQLVATRSQLATLTLKDAGSAKYQTLLKPLEEKVDELEAALSVSSVELRSQLQPVTLDAVQARLPAGAALVEFAVLTPQDPQVGKSRPPRYLAYLLPAQGPPRWVDLGETAPIDRAIAAWREALRDPERTDVKRLARVVDQRVMRPVRTLLPHGPSGAAAASARARRLLIVPDGQLNLIPFAALVDEQNRYLVERYSISYLTSGRDLLRAPEPEPARTEALIVANPAFGRPATVPMDQNPEQTVAVNRQGEKPAGGRNQVKFDQTQIFFQPLPGTAGEAESIKTVLPEAKMLLWQQATEGAIKQARAPRILHIATHGFFLGDQPSPTAEPQASADEDSQRGSDLRLSKWAAQIRDPLLRSGLALAGANQGRSQDDDGVLTALEVAGLDLWGTELVVLSACDTGVGEVKNGDGVHGLRRALVLAGSETQVMSLWPVSDNITRELMAAYYQGLTRGQGRGEALRLVQLETLKKLKRQHPFYWAAFIQSGEWANLEGRR
ncbi:MAG TPA: CHAT domain-containing tetratricopeptide repeat protein [Blastocatellia bacterium]|nr:CHAT domain-containing tetratricopeptide repeat protein [Blastocatellia bacterium]